MMTEVTQTVNDKVRNVNTSDTDLSAALSKQNHLVVQANDLAKSFGEFNLTENRVLDFLTSYVTVNSTKDDIYETNIKKFFHTYKMKDNGYYYKQVTKALKKLMTHCLSIRDQKTGITDTVPFISLYRTIDNSSDFKFKFSEEVVPYLINLKSNFYSIRLSELARIRSKYTLIFIKLWESNRIGNDSNSATISGSLDEWEDWFFGNTRRWSAGRFKQKVLNVAINEMADKFNLDEVTINNKKHGTKISGYDVTLHGKGTYHSKRSMTL